MYSMFMSKIYTKKGDDGTTDLFGGGRVTKDCVNLRVVGEIDELNSVIGVAAEVLKKSGAKAMSVVDFLNIVQRDLFKAGAELATLQDDVLLSSRAKPRDPLQYIEDANVVGLENNINKWNATLPELNNFIIPGGGNGAANLHHARAVCRRVERELVALGKDQKIRAEIYQYFNRLSDLLFVMARFVDLD